MPRPWISSAKPPVASLLADRSKRRKSWDTYELWVSGVDINYLVLLECISCLISAPTHHHDSIQDDIISGFTTLFQFVRVALGSP